MENQLTKYNDVLFKFNSFMGLKCYQKVKGILAEFDVKLKEEMPGFSNDDDVSSIDPDPANPEPMRRKVWDSSLKVDKLV